MPKPFDAVFKDLLERDPAGWVRLALGPVAGVSTLVDADISVVSGAADKVVRLDAPAALIHFEAFAAWDASVPSRALHYNAALHRRHQLPVNTVLVVLRPEADHASLTGHYQVVSPLRGRTHELQYDVIRVWKLDLEAVLTGSLATLPLAPLANQAAERLPEVIQRMRERLEAEAAPEEQKDLWTDTFVLLGLRLPRQGVVQLFRGVFGMRESDTYQMILEEGREEGRERGRLQGAVSALLLVGTARLGEPDAATRERIEGETRLAHVEEWLRHAARIESWSELPGL